MENWKCIINKKLDWSWQCSLKDDADILKMPLFGLLSTEIKYWVQASTGTEKTSVHFHNLQLKSCVKPTFGFCFVKARWEYELNIFIKFLVKIFQRWYLSKSYDSINISPKNHRNILEALNNWKYLISN